MSLGSCAKIRLMIFHASAHNSNVVFVFYHHYLSGDGEWLLPPVLYKIKIIVIERGIAVFNVFYARIPHPYPPCDMCPLFGISFIVFQSVHIYGWAIHTFLKINITITMLTSKYRRLAKNMLKQKLHSWWSITVFFYLIALSNIEQRRKNHDR